MEERNTSHYNTGKVKLGVRVTEHHRAKVNSLAETWGITVNTLIMMVIDEMYFEPMTPPILRATVEASSERVIGYFRKRQPNWNGSTSPSERADWKNTMEKKEFLQGGVRS